MHSRFTGGPARLDEYHFAQRSGPRGDMDNLIARLDQVRVAAFQLEEMERLSLRDNERRVHREIMEQEARARIHREVEGYLPYGTEEDFRPQQFYQEPARAQPGSVFPLNEQNLRNLNGSGSRNSSSDHPSTFRTSQTSSTQTFQHPEPQRDTYPASTGRQSPFWSSETGSTSCLPNHQASSRPPTVASTSARTPRTSRPASSNHHSHQSRPLSTHDSSRWEPMLEPETKDCIACLDPHPIDNFPPITPTCTHLPTLCTTCVQDALTATALNPLTINRLRCMHQGCAELLSHGDIRRLATPETFER